MQLVKNCINLFVLGTFFAVLTFVFLLSFYIYNKKTPFFEFKSLQDIMQMFITSVTILVISIPEGLPLAIALSLKYSVEKVKIYLLLKNKM